LGGESAVCIRSNELHEDVRERIERFSVDPLLVDSICSIFLNVEKICEKVNNIIDRPNL